MAFELDRDLFHRCNSSWVIEEIISEEHLLDFRPVND